MPDQQGQFGVWGKWIGRLVAAVVWGAVVFGVNALGVRFERHVNVPLVVGLWGFWSYLTGTMIHD